MIDTFYISRIRRVVALVKGGEVGGPGIARKSVACVLLVLCLFLSISTTRAADEQTPLVLGIFPIVSTVALFKRFAPLRDHLTQTLGRNVVLETAKDFPTFVKRTSERRYDIVITAPHFALKAADEGRYHIRASVKKSLVGLYVVRKDSPLQRVEELAAHIVATPPPQAVITAAGKLDLDEVAGLRGERAPIFKSYRSHNAAYEAVVGGQADAAVVSANAVNQAMKNGIPLRTIGETRPLPNMAILVAGDLPQTFQDTVANQFVSLDATPEGKKLLKELGFPGYRPASLKDYEVLRPYLKLLKPAAR